MKVLLTTEAEGDLERIGDYIALDNPRRALSFVLELRDACMSLANLHLAFPLVSRYAHSGIRRRVHENYLIFYRIEAEHVVIIHVLHGAIDYTSVLFPQEKNNVLC